MAMAVSRKMFKTMRCFRTHAQRKRISGGAKGVRFVRIYLPQLTSYFAVVYKKYFFFSFLRAAFEFRIPR